jgi:hypothetical protein
MTTPYSVPILDTTNFLASQTVLTDSNKRLITADYLNQAVKTTSSPAFAGLTIDTSTLFVDNVNHRLGIGTITPAFTVDMTADGTIPTLVLTCYGDGLVPGILGRAARGSLATPAAVQATDILATYGGRGHTGTAFSTTSRANISFRAAETWSTSAMGSYFTFLSTQIGTTASTIKAVLSDVGNFGVGFTTNAGPLEKLHSSAKVRADTVFNCNGTDGATASVAVAKVGGGTRTLNFAGGIYTGYTDS